MRHFNLCSALMVVLIGLFGCTTTTLEPEKASMGDLLFRNDDLKKEQEKRDTAAKDAKQRADEALKKLQALRELGDARRAELDAASAAAQAEAASSAKEFDQIRDDISKTQAIADREDARIKQLKAQKQQLESKVQEIKGMSEDQKRELMNQSQSLQQEIGRAEQENALLKKSIDDRLRVYQQARERLGK